MDDWEAGMRGAVMDDFDVFLNHRGPDVKATFVAHLQDALRCAGFRPFLDVRSLMKGNPALKSIDQALDMAQVHVAVVSKRYAESKYCLNELVAMMKSGKPVLPVFYDVEPVDLQWVENGPFAEAFERHKVRGRSERKVQEWRDALGALLELTGFRLADYRSDEAELMREVVNVVGGLTPSNQPVEVEQRTVGLEGPANRCIKALENMGAGIGMLGLVGMGGIGKSTLAREIYNHFVALKRFKSMTFLEIHRDLSSSNVQGSPTWLRKLRKQLLWDLLRVNYDDSTSNYRSWFQKISTLGPVFIVIDNAHERGQFEELVPFTSSFLHPGSRIIVTSRDRSILNIVADRTNDRYFYAVSTLDLYESNLLFNRHAFGADGAPEDFKDLARDVVEACGGLPLALKLTGSSLFDKRSDEDREAIWPEAVDALRQSSDVLSTLQWTYEKLTEPEKRMFVDITCLFYDHSMKEALAYWESCKQCMACDGIRTPHSYLRNLMNKNLVGVNPQSSFLRVHDLLRDLGQEIGLKAKSHFVNSRIAEATITRNQGTDKTMALNLDGSFQQWFEAQNFANMPNLHFLGLPDGCIVNGDLRCMPRELRWLQWRGMPFAHIPMGLNLSLLTSLDFSKSTNLVYLWTKSNCSLEAFPNLLRLNLSECTSLKKLPDSIVQSSRLQYLELMGCIELTKLPKFIGQLKGLEFLNVSYCSSLKALPNTIGALSNLQTLSALKCTSLVKLPTSIGLLSSLRTLEIQASTECQTTFSDEIGEAWTQLRCLILSNCSELGSFINYGSLNCLEQLFLRDCTLVELPESIGLLIHLRSLNITCERLQSLPKSVGDLKLLSSLTLSRCDHLKRLPKTLGALTSLVYLCIKRCPIRRLPRSIGLLEQLHDLEIRGCKNLLKLPTSVRQLKCWKQIKP